MRQPENIFKLEFSSVLSYSMESVCSATDPTAMCEHNLVRARVDRMARERAEGDRRTSVCETYPKRTEARVRKMGENMPRGPDERGSGEDERTRPNPGGRGGPGGRTHPYIGRGDSLSTGNSIIRSD